jgi:glycosyltransferase involved in cell wall biosynthesis
MARSALYVCYFGLRQPLVQTQVIPYLKGLVAGGWSIHLMTFEPEWPTGFSEADQLSWHEKLQEQGITWYPNKYTNSRSLFAKIRDMFSGLSSARTIIKKNQVEIIHGRAHVGATIGYLTGLFSSRKILFDIRGFNPEEYVDSGHWSQRSLKYHGLKSVEKWLIKRVSGFVILTHAGLNAMFPDALRHENDPVDMFRLPDGRPIQVIPCCVDPARFTEQAFDQHTKDQLKQKLGLSHCSRLIIHIGALGGLYPEERIVAIFAEIHRQYPNTGFMVISQTDTARLEEFYNKARLPEENLWKGRISVADVPLYLSIGDWGLSLKCESYSQLSCSPAKVPEYLLAGLPVLASQGIGDTDQIIRNNKIGIVFNAWHDESIRKAVSEMDQIQSDPELKLRCQQTAINVFQLETIGGPRYRAIYDALHVKRSFMDAGIN